MRDLLSHARTKSRLASSINQPPLVQDEVFQRRTDIAEPFHLRAGFHENILGHLHPTETPVRPLGATNWGFVALRDDRQEVKVAALVRLSPSVRAKQSHLLRLELCGNAVATKPRVRGGEETH